jgi:hypothetical protein
MASFTELEKALSELAGRFYLPSSLEFELDCDRSQPKPANTTSNAPFLAYQGTLGTILGCAKRLRPSDALTQFQLSAFRAMVGLRLQDLDNHFRSLYNHQFPLVRFHPLSNPILCTYSSFRCRFSQYLGFV